VGAASKQGMMHDTYHTKIAGRASDLRQRLLSVPTTPRTVAKLESLTRNLARSQMSNLPRRTSRSIAGYWN
jgi:hypothetical protein